MPRIHVSEISVLKKFSHAVVFLESFNQFAVSTKTAVP
jgi:hypothetical protein